MDILTIMGQSLTEDGDPTVRDPICAVVKLNVVNALMRTSAVAQLMFHLSKKHDHPFILMGV